MLTPFWSTDNDAYTTDTSDCTLSVGKKEEEEGPVPKATGPKDAYGHDA